MTVAEQLYLARTRAKLTQHTVARLAGVSRSVVWNAEAGKPLMLASVERIADAVGLEVRLVEIKS